MIKAIILDVGGTLLGATDLIENMVAGVAGTQEYRNEIRKRVVSEFFRQVNDCRNGLPFKKIVEIIDTSINTINQEFNDCLSSVSAAQVYWRTFVDDSYVINDANLALQEFARRKIELLIASDADAEVLYPQFEKYEWTQYFGKFFISSEIQAYKPNDAFVAAVYSAICEYQKHEVIFVGDSEVDVQTGKKLGVKTALIHKSDQKRYDEDYSIGSLLQLLEL